MNPVLVATAVTVVAGAIVAVSSRDARVAILGLGLTLIGAPLLADPVPDPLSLAARVVAAVLTLELLWITVRATTSASRGSLVGWPVEALAAAAAFAVGAGVGSGLPIEATALGAAGTGSTPVIVGGAFSLVALAVTPLVHGRDVLRLGLAAILLLTGGTTLSSGLAGPPGSLGQLVIAGLTVALGAAVGALCTNAFAARGDLEAGGRRAGAGGRPGPRQARPPVDE